MLCVRLAGGLGNQIFQLAAALRLRERNSERIALYTEGLSNYSVSRDFELAKFFDLPRLGVLVDDFSEMQRFLIKNRIGRWPILGCSDNNYHKYLISLEQRRDVFLDGYFQTVWNQEAFDDICQELSLALKPDAKRLRGSLIIHVRGGDFRSIPNLNICSFDWYAKAVNFALSKNPEISCVSVTSEDQFYAKELVIFLSSKCDKEILLRPNGSSLADFQYLMSQENMVIGNSTFSFWASALNNNSKICIAPSHFSREVMRLPFITKETLMDIDHNSNT